ncbi:MULTISPECIES: hypothetical protein [Streptomyces]|uniref:Uncharacterized protein n=4 Tax=Streptomyces TaxID=1883 RepID=A0A8H9LQV5_9ACTN|nr:MULTISPECIES: hypothetical protein [Streptomyces]NEE34957.1 hypothetical protein [Streptomyces sp. SID7982]NEE58276.1 hypothetical protein [Streptomyces sp. SID8455]MBL3807342.1 hypothetical protein [Streptomyces sp. BRB081]NEC15877.1 hypothetical protein [Streptomyces sp. SID8014]PJM85514.1 hypothetical protein CH313_06335 [Streptomyces sp. TSRI0384-2]
MANTQQDATKPNARDERRAARAAKSITAFAEAHGGTEAQIASLGEEGARIVLVCGDGAWGDVVVPSMEVARAATEKAGVTVHDEFAGEFAAKVVTGPYEWARMAGIQIGGPGRPGRAA